jgi:deoxyribodipyrimidine photolyase
MFWFRRDLRPGDNPALVEVDRERLEALGRFAAAREAVAP